jgi:hypothetical protein
MLVTTEKKRATLIFRVFTNMLRPVYITTTSVFGSIQVFAIDIDKPDTGTYRCQLLKHGAVSPSSGGPLTIIATIEDPTAMAKTLTYLGLPIRAPPRATLAATRSTPNGLIPNRYPIRSGSAPEPTTPLALTHKWPKSPRF